MCNEMLFKDPAMYQMHRNISSRYVTNDDHLFKSVALDFLY